MVVPGDPGQGSRPVMGHDRGDRGVDPPGVNPCTTLGSWVRFPNRDAGVVLVVEADELSWGIDHAEDHQAAQLRAVGLGENR
jgi:hypothetical protein